MATLALLCKVATQNAVKALTPIPNHRRGQGRGLSALIHDDPYNPSGAIGMGRARSRETLALAHSLFPLYEFLIHGPDAYDHEGIFPTVHLDLPPTWTQPPLLEVPSGPPSWESIISSEPSESGYEADSD